MDIAGRVAAVTGATSGIGLALAERFLSGGTKVVLAEVERPALERQVTRLAAGGAAVIGVPCAVGDPAQITALRDRTLDPFGAKQRDADREAGRNPRPLVQQ